MFKHFVISVFLVSASLYAGPDADETSTYDEEGVVDYYEEMLKSLKKLEKATDEDAEHNPSEVFDEAKRLDEEAKEAIRHNLNN